MGITTQSGQTVQGAPPSDQQFHQQQQDQQQQYYKQQEQQQQAYQQQQEQQRQSYQQQQEHQQQQEERRHYEQQQASMASSCARFEDSNFNGGNSNGGYSNSGGSDGYNGALYTIVASGTTMHSYEEHPELPNLSAGALHSSADVYLHNREAAADRNTVYLSDHSGHMAQYHEDRPLITYATDMQTNSLSRTYGADSNMAGDFATRDVDLRNSNNGYINGSEAQSRLSLPFAPTDVATVSPPIGTIITASRPISDAARQYELPGSGRSDWFQWRASLS